MSDNVISALASVQAQIGGIEKTRGGEGGISYAYRGIDAIAAAAQPLLGRAGVVIVPDSTITHVKDITVNGKPWVDTFVDVSWTIYGPGGVGDHITATTQGIGRDNSDKSYNKAATQAFKNLLLRLLCIGDPQDDADQPQHQKNYTDAPPAPVRDEADDLFDRVKKTKGTPKADELKALSVENGGLSLSARAFREDAAWAELVTAVVDA